MRKSPLPAVPTRSWLAPIVGLCAAAALGGAGCAAGDETHADATAEGTGGSLGGDGVGGATGQGGSSAGVGGATGNAGAVGTGGMLGVGGRPVGSGGAIGTGGTTAAGGRTGSGGATVVVGTGGAPGVGGFTGACLNQASTATRPQLTAAQAANDTILKYLAQAGPQAGLTTDNWNPTAGLGSVTAFPVDLIVAADGSGTHRTVQTALAAATGTARRYILVKPGTYREIVSIRTPTPITIYGAGADATQVTIINGQSSAAAGGTAQSATMTVTNNGFQIANLTISNDFAGAATGDNQAVALYTTGDKIIMQNVRLHGFQDTLYIDSPSPTTVARVYIKGSWIEGDTDFIFGRASAVIDGSTIHYLSTRKGTGAGVHLAPSTSVANTFGFLVTGCTFTADATTPANKISLGRSWDQSSTVPTPNGQAVIRESTMGAHINRAAPWATSTGSRPFSATGNRFFEYCNSGPGAAP
jgi:pectinesterase